MTHQPLLRQPKKKAQPEAQLQKTLVQIIRLTATPDLVWGASLNGVRLNIKTAKLMKAMGMEAGMPDLFFLVAGHFYGMELKAGKKGVQSIAQKNFQYRTLVQGGTYVIARDIEEAMTYLETWGCIRPRSKTRMTHRLAA